jgi:signal transduction histidine kinase/ActR/RegA family two-component response regulator
MSTNLQSDARAGLGFQHRLETHVAAAVTLVVAFALGAAMVIASRVVTNGSFERASSDLTAARSAFYRLEDDRAEFAAAQAALVTTLPVFRAYMTDSRLAGDVATMQVMADEYRHQLKAAFCIVAGRDGRWTASSGWSDGAEPPASISRMISASAAGRPGRGIAETGDRLFLVVSEPARFAEETLGTLSVGYALDDAVARRLAEVTHCDVNIAVGGRLFASSLTGDGRTALANLIASDPAFSPGGAPRMTRWGGREYVAATFALSPNGDLDPTARLVLLQDWAPARRYLGELQRQLFAAGVAIFAVALAGGLLFARRVSDPLKNLASAARDIASGNWTRQVPVRGTAEAIVMAHAFNDMTASLLHWYDEAKRRDDELREAQKMEAIGRLAGGIAHDFNNLLTSIRGYGELGMLRLDKQHPLRDDLAEILGATDRAAQLTKQLLAFSRRQAVTPRVLALDRLVAATEQMLRSVIGEEIELVTSIDPGLGFVRADRGQIEQVLLNLVINARDAMPGGGTLRIGLSNVNVGAAPHDVQHSPVPERYVCLSIADTGHGMDRQTASRVFEPFFTTKEAGRGTGLGLAIVYGIVQEAGGMIDVVSEIGRGATFRVFLPRTADGEASEPLAEDPEPAASAKGSETVLLVEDDDRLSVLIGKALRGAGYTVLQASQGEEALAIARAHTPSIHLLITDVVMPGMNGSALSARVTSLRTETRVLFMSGYPDDAVLRHGVETASVHFIRKPFSMDGLMIKMREALQGPA